jgi:hypothetical protein
MTGSGLEANQEPDVYTILFSSPNIPGMKYDNKGYRYRRGNIRL